MVIGTNYKRNKDGESNAVARRMEKAKELAKELGGDLGLASAVVLGRKTLEEAQAELAKTHNSKVSGATTGATEQPTTVHGVRP